jgi:hypothetical protein
VHALLQGGKEKRGEGARRGSISQVGSEVFFVKQVKKEKFIVDHAAQ